VGGFLAALLAGQARGLARMAIPRTKPAQRSDSAGKAALEHFNIQHGEDISQMTV
jgi:hypothetical protein